MIFLSPGVTTIEAADGLVFVDSSSNRIFAYGGTAALCLDRLRFGHDADATFRTNGPESGIPSAADLDTARHQWLDDGLIVDGDASGAAAEVPAARPTGRATPYPGWAAEWTCRFRGLTVRFAEEHPRAVPLLRSLFESFEAPGAAPDLSLEVVHPFEFEARLLEDGAEVLRTNEYNVILGAIMQRILMRLYPDTDWMAFLHSSAVRLGEKTVALVGPSGSGKSTLAAWLAAHGFDYVSDDLLAVAAPDGHAMPWPMPFSIKKGSWAVLERVYVGFADNPTRPTKGTQARLMPPPQGAWDADPSPVTALVFLTFDADQGFSVMRLSPIEALARLLNDRIWVGYPVREFAVRRLLDWLGSIQTVALTYDKLEDAERVIVELCDAAKRGTGEPAA